MQTDNHFTLTKQPPSGRITYKWNEEIDKEEVNNELRNIFGVENIHTFEHRLATPSYPYYEPGEYFPADRTGKRKKYNFMLLLIFFECIGYIDMFPKIVALYCVIVAISNDKIMKEVLEKAANYFSKLLCHESHSIFYKVFCICSQFDH